MIDLGPVGVWTRQLDTQPAGRAQEIAAEIEALGYPVLWIPEASAREVLTHATLLLAGTASLVVATGIARVHARVASGTALAQLLLDERFPGRFLLGLGVSHARIVERVMGQSYASPVRFMGEYLDAMDAVIAARHPGGPLPRVLAALGPRMLDMAAARSLGAHSYMAPVGHTAWARERLGPGAVLAPSLKVVLEADPGRARAIARGSIGPPAHLPAYRQNIARFGFTDDDFADPPSDRLVDALVAWGDETAIVAKVREHLDAGADHVCIELLTGDDTTVPMDAWRALAPALLSVS